MKIIILEGIATSGKTTIRNHLEKYFKNNNLNYLVVEENETLMPFLHNTKKKIANEHLKKILLKYFKKKINYIIFDRLYFTHIYRTNSTIHDFKEIENLIKNENGKIIFLKINNENIPKRIFNAMKYRSEDWNKYVKSKGDEKDIIKYYTNQQEKLLNHLKETEVKFKIYDTSNLKFEKISKEIIELVKLKEI